MSCAFSRFLIPRIRVRVVWGLSETMAILSPRIRLRRVDFPTFVLPRMEMKPDVNEFIGKKGSDIQMVAHCCMWDHPVVHRVGSSEGLNRLETRSRSFHQGLFEDLMDVVNKDNFDILEKIVRDTLQMGLVFLGENDLFYLCPKSSMNLLLHASNRKNSPG